MDKILRLITMWIWYYSKLSFHLENTICISTVWTLTFTDSTIPTKALLYTLPFRDWVSLRETFIHPSRWQILQLNLNNVLIGRYLKCSILHWQYYLFSVSCGLRMLICLKENNLKVILHHFIPKQVAITVHWWYWIK